MNAKTHLAAFALFAAPLLIAPVASHAYSDTQKTVINHLLKHKLMSELCGRAADETYFKDVIEKYDLRDDFWDNEEEAADEGYFNPTLLRLKFEYDKNRVSALKWAQECIAYFLTLTKYD